MAASPYLKLPKVFISYSHDSPDHIDRVLGISNRLRADGVDCNIDQYEVSPSEGWPRWTADQIEQADFVLVVCTEKYSQRFRAKEGVGVGLGVKWEGAVITQDLYDAEAYNTKFIPVIFVPQDAKYIPNVLRGATRYEVGAKDGYDSLYRHLTNQRSIVKPQLGNLRPMPPLARKQEFSALETVREDKAKLQNRAAKNGQVENQTQSFTGLRKGRLLVAVAILLGVVIGIYLWQGAIEIVPPPPTPQPSATTTPKIGPERALTYWLTVRRKHDREPFPSIGEKIFDAGSEFRLNVQTAQAGALYLFSEGKNNDGATEWNTMFPTRSNNNGDAWLQANPDKVLSTKEYVFGGQRGTVKVWVIWARERVELLDEIVKSSLNAEGVIREPARLQSFIEQRKLPRPEITPDKDRFRVTLKGGSDVLVDLKELEYQP
jgi:SEFIR domain